MTRAPAAEDGVEVALEPVEQLEPVAGGCVAELVDEPRKAVDHDEVRARLAAEETERDRKVLAPRAGEDLSAGEGGASDRGCIARPAHSPMTWINTLRSRERSSSQKKMRCHGPSFSAPSTTGIVATRTRAPGSQWECPFGKSAVSSSIP